MLSIHQHTNLKVFPLDLKSVPLKGGAWLDGESPAYLNQVRGERPIFEKPDRFEIQEILVEGKTYFFGGPMFFHFGHFLQETLSRLWALLAPDTAERVSLNDIDEIVFFRVGGADLAPEALPQFMQDMFALLGIPLTKIRILTKPTLMPNALVPEQAIGIMVNAKPEWKYLTDRLAESLGDAQPGNTSYYVSRRNFRANGTYLGESLVSSLLEGQGFKVAYPEEMTIKEQLLLYQNAKSLVFAEGSALHALSLLPGIKSRVIEIARRQSNVISKQIKAMGIDLHRLSDGMQMIDSFYGGGARAITYLDIASILKRISRLLALNLEVPSAETIADCIEQEVFMHGYIAATRSQGEKSIAHIFINNRKLFEGLPLNFRYLENFHIRHETNRLRRRVDMAKIEEEKSAEAKEKAENANK